MSEFIQERKISIMSSVSETIGDMFSNLGSLLSVSWFAWLLLFVWGTLGAYAGVSTTLAATLGVSLEVLALIVQYTTTLIQVLLTSVISIALYRYLIVGEKAEGIMFLQIGKREMVYLGYLFLFGVALVLLVGGLGGAGWLMMQSLGTGWLIYLYGLGAVILLSFFIIRTMLTLAGVALDQPEPLRSAWKITRGNCWRIFWAMVLLYLVILLVYAVVLGIGMVVGFTPAVMGEIFLSITSGKASFETILFVHAVSMILTVFSTMLGVAFLSSLYRQLTNITSGDLSAVFGEANVRAEEGA